MSTQTHFDVYGLSRAIHLGDATYELALYADDAELYVTDFDDPDRPALLLAGKSGISSWIRGRSSSAGTHRVTDAQAQPGRLTFVEECEFADGESDVYSYRAEISRGQIKRCVVSRQHLHVGEAPSPDPAPDLKTMVDDDPPPTPASPHRPTSSERIGNRTLAGHFFG